MSFLDDDFLLTNEPAKKLYHEYAEKMPIIDYHCHLEPKDIYENKNYPNLTRVWLNDGMLGDHYKWRLERANGDLNYVHEEDYSEELWQEQKKMGMRVMQR